MSEKTVLIVGGLVAGVAVLIFLSKKQQAAQQANATYLANQYANTTAGQVGGILSSVGSFFDSGALSDLVDSFKDTGWNNQPGLVPSYAAPKGTNDPGLNDYVSPTDYAKLADAPNIGPSPLGGVNYGPVALPGDLTDSSYDDESLW
jgi:hypothetical protein